MILHYVSGKSNVVVDASSYHLDLAAVFGSVEFGLLTRICMRLSQLPLVTHGNSNARKLGSACEHGFIFHRWSVVLQTHSGYEANLVIPKDAGLCNQTFCSSSTMTLLVSILACITWLVPYPNDIVRKNYILILNSIVNSVWFARRVKVITAAP